jgi:hypothetical protein
MRPVFDYLQCAAQRFERGHSQAMRINLFISHLVLSDRVGIPGFIAGAMIVCLGERLSAPHRAKTGRVGDPAKVRDSQTNRSTLIAAAVVHF